MKRLFASTAVVMLALAGGAALAQNKPGAIGDVEGTTQLPSYKLGNEGPQPANRDAVNVAPDAANVAPTSEAPALSGDTGEKQVMPAERFGNTGPKPANRDAVKR